MTFNLNYSKGYSFFLTYFILILCVKCINLKYSYLMQNAVSQNVGTDNPWKVYFDKYLIDAHESGVYIDLGGVTGSYLYTKGKCPVFNKIIVLGNNHSFLERVPVHSMIFKDIALGYFSSISNVPTGGFNIPLSHEINSPSKIDSILGCSRFVQQVQCCENPTTLTNCVNMPFAYDLDTKNCYVLFFNSQEKTTICGNENQMYCYKPEKNIHSLNMVYGSSFIRDDWESKCPSNAIKGGHFGKWSGGSCTKMTTSKLKTLTPAECGALLFEKSDKHDLGTFVKGTNYANWQYGTCELIHDTPDCFYSSPTGFAFTSLGSINEATANFPPCNSLSEGWVQCDYKNKNPGSQCENNNSNKCIDGQWTIFGASEDNNLIIILSAVGASLVVILLVAGGYHYISRRNNDVNKTKKDYSSEFINDNTAKRPSDDIADTSFWKENGDTQVIIEREY